MAVPGRNEPCYCGSGKKYKKCCIGKTPVSPPIKSEQGAINLLTKYDKIDLLRIIAGLQLHPANHGKNIRLEILNQNILKQKRAGTHKMISVSELKAFFKSNYTSHYLEDPVSNFFTENTTFYGGNYIVYPGINFNGTLVLNSYLEAIFFRESGLPASMVKELYQGLMVMLSISNSMAFKANHQRYLDAEDSRRAIHVPEEAKLNSLKRAVTFSEHDMINICSKCGVPLATIDEFLLDQDLPTLGSYDPMTNPVASTPILKVGYEYIFMLPGAVVNVLTNFIKKKARQYKVLDHLDNFLFKVQYSNVLRYLSQMNWKLTDIKLPSSYYSENNLEEAIFSFDHDKLAYVCFMNPYKASSHKDENLMEENFNSIEDRENQVLNYLDGLNNQVRFRYLSIYILGQNGDDIFFMVHRSEGENLNLSFIYGQFQSVVFYEKLDRLSLWKFAKAYSKAHERVDFSPATSILDAYVMYKGNNGSLLLPDDPVPTFMVLAPGMSGDFEREVTKRRDEHSALVFEQDNIGYTPVISHKDYAPIYIEREVTGSTRLLIESYGFPIWISNYQAEDPFQRDAAYNFIEAIAFWLYKLSPELSKHINKLNYNILEVRVDLNRRLILRDDIFEFSGSGEVECQLNWEVVKNNILRLHIPYSIVYQLVQSDNRGERLIIYNIVIAFNELLRLRNINTIPEHKISELLDLYMPLGPAKMLLYINGSRNPKLDNRWLLPVRYVSDVESSIILDNLVNYLNLPDPIPEKISSVDEKNKLCNAIVATLIKKVVEKLQAYNAEDVISWLLELNESCVNQREYRSIIIPAKIACFSDIPTELDKFLKEEKSLVETSLSIRCLIEFVAAEPQHGSRILNFDDLDELLALMNEVIVWGMLADTINLKMSDPDMGLLPSGRIGTDKSFFDKQLKPFNISRSETELYDYIDHFQDKYSFKNNPEAAEYTSEIEEVDEAFVQEYGVSMTRIMQIKGELVNVAIEKETSVISMEEKTLKDYLKIKIEDITDREINIGLELLSLTKRNNISKPPAGYEKSDIYPWRYNRALSFLRKPIIKLSDSNEEKVVYYWGFRHILVAASNLQALLFSGRLKGKSGGKLNSLLSRINEEKGKAFRDKVKDWLKSNTTLDVVDYEVKMKPKGHLASDEDLGDIDILAIDRALNVVYSIECKDTVSARAIHEMKTELDKYLGRDGEPGMIGKHVRRNEWLILNNEKVMNFCKIGGCNLNCVKGKKGIPLT